VDLDFNDLIDILDGEEFDERPVDLRTFVTSPDYLGLPELSEYQYIQNRSDSDLIAVIEQLGEEANGWAADLAVVDIPEDVKWYIDEYDGIEHVAEIHRTWYGND